MYIKGLNILILLLASNVISSKNLSLSEIENIAINNAPELAKSINKENSLLDLSISESRMPDPKLQIGVINVPTDTFSLKQDNMTQIKFGVMQNIPRGDVLSIKDRQKKLLAESEHYNYLNSKAIILKTVRNEWINLYYWLNALEIINKNLSTFKELIKISESIYASGKTNQHDVFQAQLEFSKLENQKIIINEQIDETRARISEWIGLENAEKLYPNKLPDWEVKFNINQLANSILNHPRLIQDNVLVNVKQQDVKLAKQDYKPDWNIGAFYSVRSGDFTMSNKHRTDLVGAQLSFDLPFFTKYKQDKKLTSKLNDLNSAKDNQQIDYKKFKTEVFKKFAQYNKLIKQNKIYNSQLIPEAKQFAKASLIAYKNNQTDFLTVSRAYITELNTILEGLKIKSEYNQIEADLLYLYEGNEK